MINELQHCLDLNEWEAAAPGAGFEIKLEAVFVEVSCLFWVVDNAAKDVELEFLEGGLLKFKHVTSAKELHALINGEILVNWLLEDPFDEERAKLLIVVAPHVIGKSEWDDDLAA